MRYPKIAIDVNKVTLICFLLYNYGSVLESYENEKESYNIFKTGLEFSLSLLGDINLYTSMFKSKLSSPIYNDIKKYSVPSYVSITNSESSSNMTNTKSLDKSLDKSFDHEDLLTKQLRRYNPKKLSLTKHLQINNSPKSKKESSKKLEAEKVESFEKNIEDSIISNITHNSVITSNSNSVRTVNDNLEVAQNDKGFSIDNYKIEIKGEENVHEMSVETIVERHAENIVIRNQHPDKKSSTIDNIKKKPSRLKELFSMAAGSSKSVNLNKHNSINSLPKILTIFEKGTRKGLKTDSTFKSVQKEVNMYHEVMNSIDHDNFHISSYLKQMRTLSEAVKKEHYDNFVSNLSETPEIKKFTGIEDITPKKKTSYKLKLDASDNIKQNKKISKKDLIINHFGKNLVHESGILYPENFIANQIEYRFFEDENNGILKLI
jgi:hypothetical protein